jgi:hypothetical protein
MDTLVTHQVSVIGIGTISATIIVTVDRVNYASEADAELYLRKLLHGRTIVSVTIKSELEGDSFVTGTLYVLKPSE